MSDFYHTKECNSNRGPQYPCDCSCPIKKKIVENLAIMDSDFVCEAAKSICRARCGLFDRDPNCQEHGRCGNNWEWYKASVFRIITKPVI
jgi:hypothetical protein